MVITEITPQKHDASRCNISVDGRFFCGMQLITVLEHRLKVGSIVTEEELSELQFEGEKRTALDKALTHISVSMKTEQAVRDFLRQKGFLGNVSDYVVEKMKEYGFLDDAVYAKDYVESVGKRKGSRLIRMELRKKGVAEDCIEAALEERGDENDAAISVAGKYLRGKEMTAAMIRKTYMYLLSKGFDYDTANAALREIVAERKNGEVEDES